MSAKQGQHLGSTRYQGELMLANIPLSQRVLLRALATGLERNLDLASLVTHVACEFTGGTALYQRQLAYRLQSGEPLIEALRQTPQVLDSTIVAALALAEQKGDAASWLRQTIDCSSSLDSTVLNPLQGSIQEVIRSIAGILLSLMMISFFLLFIVPSVERLVEEFGLHVPYICSWLFKLGQNLPLLLFFTLLILLLVVGFNIPSLATYLQNRFRPDAWQVSWVSGRAKLLSLLALVAHFELGFERGLATIATCLPDAATRRRLESARSKVRDGNDPAVALRDARLVSAHEYQALVSTESAPARAWLLQRFAERQAERSRSRLWWVTRIAAFICHFIFGTIVTFIAIMVFVLVISLVSGLS